MRTTIFFLLRSANLALKLEWRALFYMHPRNIHTNKEGLKEITLLYVGAYSVGKKGESNVNDMRKNSEQERGKPRKEKRSEIA